jgi:hypothetical protein
LKKANRKARSFLLQTRTLNREHENADATSELIGCFFMFFVRLVSHGVHKTNNMSFPQAKYLSVGIKQINPQ